MIKIIVIFLLVTFFFSTILENILGIIYYKNMLEVMKNEKEH